MTTQMITVTTQVPEDIYLVLQANGIFREILAERSRHLLAARFYQERVLSLGQAARLAGLDRWAFIELLAEHQIPVIDYTEEELAVEFKAVDQVSAELDQ
jgi:predicted HTH domain antitoxin